MGLPKGDYRDALITHPLAAVQPLSATLETSTTVGASPPRRRPLAATHTG